MYIVTFANLSLLVAKIRRTESVPSDINNPVDRPAEAPQFGTLPKAITKKVNKTQTVLNIVSGSYVFACMKIKTTFIIIPTGSCSTHDLSLIQIYFSFGENKQIIQ